VNEIDGAYVASFIWFKGDNNLKLAQSYQRLTNDVVVRYILSVLNICNQNAESVLDKHFTDELLAY
jgi:hypothetical protein